VPRMDPKTNKRLIKLMFDNYTTDKLKNISPEEFQKEIENLTKIRDFKMEGYSEEDLERQRGLSVNFRWGHNHNFGTFEMEGRMGNRHINLMNKFCELFDVDLDYFKDKKALDIGCWTGGTSLLLNALGAEVTAIEEVKKYADTVKFMKDSFGLDSLNVESKSLYDIGPEHHEKYDIVYFPGVLYHVSDPLLALRILYNCLKVGGIILVETAYIRKDGPYCDFLGGTWKREAAKEDLGGWVWFRPSPSCLNRWLLEAGFGKIRVKEGIRLQAYAKKTRRNPITRAGLARPNIP